MDMNEYLETVAGQIRSSKARAVAIDEIRNHVTDQADMYQKEGMTREQALHEAVRQMGDPVTAGVELDRIHRPRMEWRLFAWILLLSVLGLGLQYFCFYRLASVPDSGQAMAFHPMTMFVKQCGYTAVGLVIMAGICLLDYSLIAKYSMVLAACFLGALAVLCGMDILPVVNGGHGYLKCLLYLFVPLYAGILYRSRGKGHTGIITCILWIMAAFAVATRAVGGGLGITIDALMVCCVMLFIAVFQTWFGISRKAGITAAGAWGAVSILLLGLFAGNALAPYQLRRLQVWLAPERYSDTAGYSVVTIRKIVSSLSMNRSCYTTLDREGLLPFLHNSGAYSNYMILQTATVLGLAKALLLIALLALFLVYLFRMAVRETNQLGRMTALGCTMILALETLRSVLFNFGLGLGSTGGILFLSYGKCHTLVIYALLGILLSVYRYRNLVWEQAAASVEEKGVLGKLGSYVIRVEKQGKQASS